MKAILFLAFYFILICNTFSQKNLSAKIYLSIIQPSKILLIKSEISNNTSINYYLENDGSFIFEKFIPETGKFHRMNSKIMFNIISNKDDAFYNDSLFKSTNKKYLKTEAPNLVSNELQKIFKTHKQLKGKNEIEESLLDFYQYIGFYKKNDLVVDYFYANNTLTEKGKYRIYWESLPLLNSKKQLNLYNIKNQKIGHFTCFNFTNLNAFKKFNGKLKSNYLYLEVK